MRVVINAVSAKMGGAVTYLTNVLRLLPPAETGHEFVVFLPAGTAKKQKDLAPNVRLIPTNIGHASWWKRLWWEQVTLRRQLRNLRGDVLFSTANFGMFSCHVRQILLVRIPLYFSKIYLERFLPLHPLKFRVSFRLRRWLCCQSVRWADAVMTPTQTMLDDLGRFVRLDRQRTLVNPYGTELASTGPVLRGAFRTGGSDPGGQDVRLCYVSFYAEHKNLRTLLEAMPLLNRSPARRFLLKTTVNPGWEGARWTCTHSGDIALAERPDVAKWVEFVGPFGASGTRALYRESDICVFPSIAESFGHPMAEAMSVGLPVVAADTPVNREICGEAAVYFCPLDADDLARAVRRVYEDASLRDRLRREGRRRTYERFRWDEHVRRILEVVQLESEPGRCCAA